MSNLTSDRDTEFVDELHRDQAPVAAGTKICNGAAVALDAGGFAVSAGPGAAHLRGIADETVDNSADAVGGALTIEIFTPEAAYFDGTGFTQADVGKPVYFSDDHTVTKTAGTNTFAGRIRSVDQYGILVDLRGGYVEPVLNVTAEPMTTVAPTTEA
jgi:hypothetical protein